MTGDFTAFKRTKRGSKQIKKLKQQNIFVNVSEIDLQQDDEVEIIDGEFKGVRGFLKTTQGKYGGMVIVPVSFDTKQTYDSICFTIEAKAEQIAIVCFATRNRHASDIIRCVQRMVEKCSEQYIEGEPLSEDMIKKMQRYWQDSGIHGSGRTN